MADINVTLEAGGLWDNILPPATNQVFSGEINLSRLITNYALYTVDTDIAITASSSKTIGAKAEILLVADGSHTPTFSEDFTVWPISSSWDTTEGTVFALFVWYDGTYVHYSLINLTTLLSGGGWINIPIPALNQIFSGEVDLTRLLTHYAPYTVVTDVAVTASASKAVCGQAEILMTADGSHTPQFNEAFTAWPDSDDWNTTAGAVHKVGFYYDGTYIYYCIKVISVPE